MQINAADNQMASLQAKANELVGQVFFGTLLREFRESSEMPFLSGTPGGTAFLRQLDQELITRLSRRQPSPLADALVKQLQSKAQARYAVEASLHEAAETGRMMSDATDSDYMTAGVR